MISPDPIYDAAQHDATRRLGEDARCDGCKRAEDRHATMKSRMAVPAQARWARSSATGTPSERAKRDPS